MEQNVQLWRVGMATALVTSAVTSDLRPWLVPLVRLGYVAKGIIFVLIGALAVRLAAGLEGGRLMDPSGALRVVLRQPFGLVLLAVIGIAIITYAAWQIIEGVADTRRKGSGWRGWTNRSLTIVKGVAYGTIGVEAMRIVLGIRGARGGSRVLSNVMRVPLGDWFLVLVGLGIAAYGLQEMWNGWKARFGDDLDVRRLKREAGPWAIVLGRAGNVARGVILVTIGGLLTRAGLDRTPAEAGGIAYSLRILFDQPFGWLILTAVAAGLVCFGIFQLLHARYARL